MHLTRAQLDSSPQPAKDVESKLTQTMRSNWMMAALACMTFAICCLRSFSSLHTPYLFWGDQLGYATKGLRLAQGELPYRDFFELATPGTDIVYAALFRCFGVSAGVVEITVALLSGATTLWMTWCARRLIRGPLVVVPALLMMGFVLSGSLDGTHHGFSTLAILAAAALLFDPGSATRVMAAGAICGLSASFTQTKGAAAALVLAGFLLWQSLRDGGVAGDAWRRPVLLCGSALLVFAAVNGPFLAAAGFSRWTQDVIVFPLRYFGTASANNWHGAPREFAERRGILKWLCFPFLYLSVPLAYLWFFVERHRRAAREPDQPWDQLTVVALAGVAMLAVIASALSIRRISFASPPAMVLLVWLLGRMRPSGVSHMLPSGAKIAAALGAASLVVALGQIVSIHRSRGGVVDLPIGRVYVADGTNAEVYRWMTEHTRPGQWYFGMPPYTLPLLLRNPAPVEATGPGEYCRPEQVAATVQGLERSRPPLLLLRPSIYVPHQTGDKVDHLRPFHDYLLQNYRETKVFTTGDEVWERVVP